MTDDAQTEQTGGHDAAVQTGPDRAAFAAIADPAALTRAELARRIDHTLLRTDATGDDVNALLAEAQQFSTFSICVSPSNLPIAHEPGDVAVCTVVGFPSGKHHAGVKAVEATRAVVDGATEIDMVIDISLLKADRADLLQQEIEAVRRAAPSPVLLKVIIESAALTDEEIVTACTAAEAAGADYVKTSTGFHSAGGASEAAVRLMRETVGDRLGVKASGGIRDAETALVMLAAGASRLGASATAAILAGWGDAEEAGSPEGDPHADSADTAETAITGATADTPDEPDAAVEPGTEAGEAPVIEEPGRRPPEGR